MLSEAVIEQVYDRTGGVPLFVEEFTKMVQESRPASNGVATRQSSPSHEIPATLQDSMNARLDRMESEQEVAQLAATLGREFSYELMAAVAPLDEASLQAELDTLVRAKSCSKKAGRREVPTPSSTPCSRRVVQLAGEKRRQEFHRRAAECLNLLSADRRTPAGARRPPFH